MLEPLVCMLLIKASLFFFYRLLGEDRFNLPLKKTLERSTQHIYISSSVNNMKHPEILAHICP